MIRRKGCSHAVQCVIERATSLVGYTARTGQSVPPPPPRNLVLRRASSALLAACRCRSTRFTPTPSVSAISRRERPSTQDIHATVYRRPRSWETSSRTSLLTLALSRSSSGLGMPGRHSEESRSSLPRWRSWVSIQFRARLRAALAKYCLENSRASVGSVLSRLKKTSEAMSSLVSLQPTTAKAAFSATARNRPQHSAQVSGQLGPDPGA
jgi:hypothetical protein